MKAQDLYKLEEGHYFLRVDPTFQAVDELMKVLKDLAARYIFITVVFAEQGSIEFIPKPKEK